MTSTTGRAGSELVGRALGRVTGAGIAVADVAAEKLAAGGLDSARAVGATREEIRRHIAGSPHQRDGVFVNPEPLRDGDPDLQVFTDMMRRPGRPRRPVLVTVPDFEEPADLAVTWLGHASSIVDIDGVRVLTDPVLTRRCSPSRRVGPARMHPAPLRPAALPALDVVLISHDHYDHLDMATVVSIAHTQPAVQFVAPIGVGAHLIAWGIAEDRVHQADWGERRTVAGLEFVCGPARHFSGRWLARNLTQWASWAIIGPRHRVFFSGDTGFTERFADLGAQVGPFDLSMIAVGAYDPMWPDIHVDPEEAVAIHRMLSGTAGADSVFLPIHWGTFSLARHSWAQPITRLLPAAERNNTSVLIPQPGGTIDIEHRVGTGTERPDWWEASA